MDTGQTKIATQSILISLSNGQINCAEILPTLTALLSTEHIKTSGRVDTGRTKIATKGIIFKWTSGHWTDQNRNKYALSCNLCLSSVHLST